MKETKIILASASPRRKELLAQIGFEFEVLVSDVEEHVTTEIPHEVVEELSYRKAEAVAKLCIGMADANGPDAVEARVESVPVIVIGADTIVACDGQILGKPKDKQDAFDMLMMLQGRTHQVYTGVTLVRLEGESVTKKTFHEATEVTFYPMSEDEIWEYVDTLDPMDKAGAYGIQGFCARYIKGICGDYNNVVGLPVGRLYQELQQFKNTVIFDLDGTLSDSIHSIKYCTDAVMAKYGYGPFTVKQYQYFVGDGAANLIKRALTEGGDTALTHFEEAFAAYKEIFREHCMYKVKPYDGIVELLAALKARGIKICVLSNKPHAETINVIETLFGKDYFDVILGQTEQLPIKPSPEGVYAILQKLGVKAEDTLYLGDTATDMKTGKSAGLFTVGALWGFRDYKELSDNHADAIIERPEQLLEYL